METYNNITEPIYSIGLDRILNKKQIKNPYTVGPACFAIPSGMYTQDEPLKLGFLDYVNPRLDAYIDKMAVLGADFSMWSKVGFKITKNGDYWVPNIMTAITVMPESGFGNWINPPPYWSNLIGFDQKIRTGDQMVIEIFNESATLGYIWFFIAGHYELMEESIN